MKIYLSLICFIFGLTSMSFAQERKLKQPKVNLVNYKIAETRNRDVKQVRSPKKRIPKVDLSKWKNPKKD